MWVLKSWPLPLYYSSGLHNFFFFGALDIRSVLEYIWGADFKNDIGFLHV